jgi:hypothetical protein
MIRPLPPILSRLIPRLSSPFDGERLATVAAIERALRSSGIYWNDLAAAVSPQAPLVQCCNYEPRRTESELRSWLTAISREPWLNDWTAGFVANLLRRPSLDALTGKQLAVVDRIIRQAQDRGVRAGRAAA